MADEVPNQPEETKSESEQPQDERRNKKKKEKKKKKDAKTSHDTEEPTNGVELEENEIQKDKEEKRKEKKKKKDAEISHDAEEPTNGVELEENEIQKDKKEKRKEKKKKKEAKISHDPEKASNEAEPEENAEQKDKKEKKKEKKKKKKNADVADTENRMNEKESDPGELQEGKEDRIMNEKMKDENDGNVSKQIEKEVDNQNDGKKKDEGESGKKANSENNTNDAIKNNQDKETKKKDKKKKKQKADKEIRAATAKKPDCNENAENKKKKNRSGTEKNKTSLPDGTYEKVLKLAETFARISTMSREHNMKISQTNNILSKVEVILTTLETTQNTYQYIWKIENFLEHFTAAKTGRKTAISSPEVESHHYGYKLGITLCPNGDGVGRNTHMSLFFCMLKGAYDDLLPWPFTCALRFSLLDQMPPTKNKARENIVGIFIPNASSSNEPFLGQPTSFRNLGLGLPKFASHEAIFEKEDKYIVDDTIFIKIEIDLNGLVTSLDI